MKKNLLGLLALFVAISIVAFSSFGKAPFKVDGKDAPARYITWDGSGPQDNLASYTTSLATAPTIPPSDCEGSSKLCWIKVEDRDHDEDIDAADFAATFAALNTVEMLEENTLNEEIEITGVLQKKAN